jgi:anion-transporting  ArsA/GET3 family ATPase
MAEAACKSKKKRSPNFTEAEKDLFVDVILPDFKSFIECKKTDAQTNETKARKWEEAAAVFNALSTVHHRSVENLQNLWDNLKKAARAASAHEKRETFETGDAYFCVPLLLKV